MHQFSRRLLLVTTCLAAPLAGGPAVAQSWNLYQSNTSFSLPFLGGPLNFQTQTGFGNREGTVAISVAGSAPINVVVDTGSTGIAISENLLPASVRAQAATAPRGAYNYDSSGNTPVGYFAQVPVNFLNFLPGNQATSVGSTTVTILVVTNGGTTYFGIGNNRSNVYGGNYNTNLTFNQNVAQGNIAQISPLGFNPLINVSSANGTPLPNQGYVVSNSGVQVGLTQANNGYSFVKLMPANGPNLWGTIPAALSSAGAPYVNGTVLLDTGIFNAFLTPGATTGQTVRVSLPGQSPQQGAFYSFIVPSTPCGGSTALTPCQVLPDSVSTTPFLNTGRQFYSGFNYLFDPTNGYVGYALSDSGLATGQTITPLLALQGNVGLANGFATNLPTVLFAPTTLAPQAGSTATFNASFLGFGSNLAVNGGGAIAFNGSVDLGGGSLSLQQGTVSVNAGLTATQVTVAQPGVLNNGTASTITGNLANAGTVANSGVIFGSVTNAGTMTNNGAVLGSVTNIGTLNGSGTIAGTLLQGGTVAPGNSIGTMTVGGNFAQFAGSTYQVEVAGAGLSDRINVGGTAALGGQVVVSALPGMTFAPSTTYTIVNAASGLSGTFASVNELYPFLLSTLSYDANNAYLNLAIGGFATAAATPTQAAVGNVLDANVNNATGDFATVLGAMAFNTFGNTQAQATLQAISGNNYAGFSTSMVQGAQLFMNNFANQTGGGGSPVSNRVALAEACDVACDVTTSPKWGAWGGALGGLGTIGANQSVGSVTYNAGGFAAGLDRSITDSFRMGVTAGYTTGTQWTSGFDGLGRSNTFQVGLYGGFAQDKLYADALIGYAYTWNQMWRNITVPGLQQRTALGQTGANQWYGQLETGYRFDLGTTPTPSSRRSQDCRPTRPARTPSPRPARSR